MRILAERGSRLRREIDHALGTPILLAFGLTRRPRSIPANIQTIGIISCSAIGDTIVASAIARDIKAALPDCRIKVFISASCTGISTIIDGFDEEVILPVARPSEAIRVMREHPTDVLIDVLPWPRITALIAALSPAGYTIGFNTSNQHRHFAYDTTVEHLGTRHEVENLRALLAPLGIHGSHYPRARLDLRLGLGQQTSGRTAALHPWASGFRSEMREWPLDRWAELGRALIDDGSDVIITGGPSDRARAEALSAMIDRPGQVRILAGSATLVETAEYLASAAVVISVNTGTMHLAAALGRDLVALHGPTNPERWGPLSTRATVMGPGEAEGGAYLNLGFEYPPNPVDCMSQIQVDDVLAPARAYMRARDDEPVVGRRIEALSGPAAELVNAGHPTGDWKPPAIGEPPAATPAHTAPVQTGIPALSRRSIVAKRAVDIVCSLVLLLLTLPVLLLIAAAIKLDSRGPVLFRQRRFGYRGGIVNVYKFRSMYQDATDEDCRRQTSINDARVTRVGAIIRKRSLDELPQLFNVLKGEMSLVGPRPHAVYTNVNGVFLEDIVESYKLRYHAKPGITGVAQINGGRGPLNTVDEVVKRVNYDLWYISNWSLWLDIKILLRTAVCVWDDEAAH